MTSPYTQFCKDLNAQTRDAQERMSNEWRCVESVIAMLNDPPLSSLEGAFLYSLREDFREYESVGQVRLLTEPERDALLHIVWAGDVA